jgi:hypothetical protein
LIWYLKQIGNAYKSIKFQICKQIIICEFHKAFIKVFLIILIWIIIFKEVIWIFNIFQKFLFLLYFFRINLSNFSRDSPLSFELLYRHLLGNVFYNFIIRLMLKLYFTFFNIEIASRWNVILLRDQIYFHIFKDYLTFLYKIRCLMTWRTILCLETSSIVLWSVNFKNLLLQMMIFIFQFSFKLWSILIA